MSHGMARSRGMAEAQREPVGARGGTVRVKEEILELDLETARDIGLLRGLMGRVNGPAHPQPYLVEGPPGQFRLYVGSAAERVRTQHGIL